MSYPEALQIVYNKQLLTSNECESIFGAHQKAEIKKGDFLLKENQIAREYYVLESGLLRAYVFDFNKLDITTNFFTANEVVIEVASLFRQIPSQENIQALTDCVLWKIEFNTFQKLFHELKAMREWGRSWFVMQLISSKQRAIEMITVSAKERYLRLVKEKPFIIQHAPLKTIAAYLGITDTSLSRLRKEIADKI